MVKCKITAMVEWERTNKTHLSMVSLHFQPNSSIFFIEERHSYDDLAEKALQDLERCEYARTFFLGFDLKKTLSNHWYVVEVNGRHTGLKGLERVNADFSEQQFADTVRQKHGMIPTGFSEILIQGFRQYAERQMNSQNVPKEVSEENGKLIKRMVQSITGSIHFNEEGLEETLTNKMNHKNLLPREAVAPFLVLDGTQSVSDLRRWIKAVASQSPEDFQQNLVVIKNPVGLQGRDVFIRRLDKLTQNQLSVGYMAEPFIKSLPIMCTQDGLEHDACMRFGTFASVDNDRKVDFTHAGGYWRLSPQATLNTKARLKNRYTANLSRGAHPETATQQDLEEAQTIVEKCTIKVLSKFYNGEFTKKS